MKNWHKLCTRLSDRISSDLSEEEFEAKVIDELDNILGWESTDEENIQSQVSIQMGSTKKCMDIIIRKNDKPLFVIEVKKPSLTFDHSHRDQLKSYMRQLKLSIGILIGSKIQVFYDTDSDFILIDDIAFIEDSEKGLNFIKTFSKENYSEENIQNYIHEKEKQLKEKQHIKKLKNEIVSQKYNDRTTEILKDEICKEYQIQKNEIDKIFEKLEIKIEVLFGGSTKDNHGSMSKGTIAYSKPLGTDKNNKNLDDNLIVQKAEYGGYKVVQLKSKTITVYKDGEKVNSAIECLCELAKSLNVSILNPKGNPHNTRQLGSHVIKAIKNNK